MLGVAAGSLSSQRVLWLEDVKGVLLLGIDGDAETLQWPVIATWHRAKESRVDAKGGAWKRNGDRGATPVWPRARTRCSPTWVDGDQQPPARCAHRRVGTVTGGDPPFGGQERDCGPVLTVTTILGR
jgi:hypothetical protein